MAKEMDGKGICWKSRVDAEEKKTNVKLPRMDSPIMP